MEKKARINRFKAGMKAVSGRTSGISFLNPAQYMEVESTGLIPQFFKMDEAGNPVRVPAYSYQQRPGSKVSSGDGAWQDVITDTDLKYLYDRLDICRRGVDRKPDDALRKPFKVNLVTTDGKVLQDHPVSTQINELNKTLKVRRAFGDAIKSQRLYGLGIVIVGYRDGRPLDQPVERTQGVEYLRTVWRIDIEEIQRDDVESSPTYGEIRHYKIRVLTKNNDTKTVLVHASRVIRVCQNESLWGTGNVTPLFDILQVLKNVDWAAGETYYQLASPILVLTWQGETTPPDEAELDHLEDEMGTIHVLKRWVLPDKYDLQWIGPPNQLPNPNDWWKPLLDRSAAGFGVPRFILLGSEAGQVLSQETTLQQYYADVVNLQTPFIEDALIEFYTRLDALGVLNLQGNILDIVWQSLWEEPEKQVWERNKLKAESMKILIDSGVLTTVEAYLWLRNGEMPDREEPGTPEHGEFTPRMPGKTEKVKQDE